MHAFVWMIWHNVQRQVKEAARLLWIWKCTLSPAPYIFSPVFGSWYSRVTAFWSSTDL